MKLYALLTLSFIALVEVVVGRTSFVFTELSPETNLGVFFNQETQVIQNDSTQPKVLIFGTSRAQGAFLPTEIEEELGLQRGQVLNLAMGGSHVVDELAIYQRNRSKLSSARSVIIQLDSYALSAGMAPGARYRRFASWSDRMAYHGRERAGLIEDYFFQTDVALPAVSYYFKTLVSTGHAPRHYGLDQFGRLAMVRIGDDHEAQKFTEAVYRHRISVAYANFQYSPVMEDQLVRLVRMATEDGARVYLIHMPVVDGYRRLVEALPTHQDDQVRAKLIRLAGGLNARLAWWQSPNEVGLEEPDFRDFGHLNTRGARKFSRYVARWIKSPGASDIVPVVMDRSSNH